MRKALVACLLFCSALHAQYDAFEFDADGFYPLITVPFNGAVGYTGSATITSFTASITSLDDGVIDGLGSSALLDGVDDSVSFDVALSGTLTYWTMGAWFRTDTTAGTYARQGMFSAGDLVVELVEDSEGFSIEARVGSYTPTVLTIDLVNTVFDPWEPFFVYATRTAGPIGVPAVFIVGVSFDSGSTVLTESSASYPLASFTSSVGVNVGRTLELTYPPAQDFNYFDGNVDAFFFQEYPWTDLYAAVDHGWLGAEFVRGDANSDGAINLADVTYITDWVYLSGSEPTCIEACDVQDDGNVDAADAVYLAAHLFSSGSPPAAPFSSCGLDSDVDFPSCRISACP